MSAKRKNTKPLRITESGRPSYYTAERRIFDLTEMPAFDNGVKTEPSNVSEEISQQSSAQNPICIPGPLGTSSYADPARWHVSLALPIDAHASPTMVFSANKFYNPGAFPGSSALPNGFVQHHGANSTDSTQTSSVQQWYKPPQQGYNETDKSTGDRHEASNGHKAAENTSTAQSAAPAVAGSATVSTASGGGGNLSNSRASHNGAKKKTNTKFKYTYQDRLSGNVKYKCNTCEYCTNRSDHYKRHLLVHSELKPFKCCRCGYCTGRSDHFRRHLTRHGFSVDEIRRQYIANGIKTTQGSSDNSYRMKQQQGGGGQISIGTNQQQQQQQQQQQGNSSAQNHHHQQQQQQQQQHHHSLQQNDHQLSQSSTPSLSSLQQQQQQQQHDHHHSTGGTPSNNASSSPKRHVCDQCGYATNRHSHFVRHSRTHSTERPFSCEHCGKRFKLDDYRKKHRCTGTTMVQAKQQQQRQNRQSPNRGSSSPPRGGGAQQQQQAQQQPQPSVTDKVPSTPMLPFPMPPNTAAAAMQQMGFADGTAVSMFPRAMVGMDTPQPRPMCTSCGMWFHRISDYNGHTCGSLNM